jgi:DNA (cytosine-5)-methyltransferase 1
MRTTKPDFELDERHFLYREYLRIVANHAPAVFVMENVKGLLTSRHAGEKIVSKIIKDLGAPGKALNLPGQGSLRYHLKPLAEKQRVLFWMEDAPQYGEEFLVRSEEFGIPQMRHRIFIVGVRSDLLATPNTLESRSEVPVSAVIDDLPRIRSRLNREADSCDAWRAAVLSVSKRNWMTADKDSELGRVTAEIRRALRLIAKADLDSGARSMPYGTAGTYANRSEITLHESRSHMRDDLHRYLFCACFGKVHGRSPKLRDFPADLRPDHQNVDRASGDAIFEDRFRVQLPDRPSMTITSHISKDGHYFIHYDPVQCRSLTVREAGRIQTFPDDYFFEGNRTEQYHQVGNAVPPALASQIASIVAQLLRDSAVQDARLA